MSDNIVQQPVLVPMPELPQLPSPQPLTDEEQALAMEDYRLMRHPLRERLMAQEITPETVIPKREFLFRLFGKPCFPKGELVAITGKAKSGKTYLCSSLMTTAIGGACLGFKRQAEHVGKVLWIDTEQSEESTQEILVNRIRVLVPEECLSSSGRTGVVSHLPKTYNLRSVSWDCRMEMIEAAIEVHQPDLVVFDGIRDVVADINDGVMAQQVVERLMQMASAQSACIVCVLHQNKAAEDSTLRGALGTELGNKCFEAYECKKQEGVFSVEQTATRKYDIREKLYFTVADTGLPVLSGSNENGLASQQIGQKVAAENPYTYYKNGQRYAHIQMLLEDTVPCGQTRMNRTELAAAFAEKLQGSVIWAEKIIDTLLKRDLLVVHTSPEGFVSYSRRA